MIKAVFYFRLISKACVVLIVSHIQAQEISPDNPDWVAKLNAEGTPITVFKAKKIYTMDPGRPEASAIAVLDGKVLSTGTIESMHPWLSRYEYEVDSTLADKIILPGFVAPHTHFWLSSGFLGLHYIGSIEAPNPKGGMYAPVESFDDVMAKLTEFEKGMTDPNEPLVAYGYDQAKQGGELNKDVLDKISSTRPITVIAFAPHFVYLNTPALKILEEKYAVGSDTQIHGIQKDKNGNLNGVFIEALAVTAGMQPVFNKVMENGGVNGLLFMGEIAKSVGVTTTSELTYGAIDFDKEWDDTETAMANQSFSLRMRLVPLESALNRKYGIKKLEEYHKMLEKNTDRLFIDGIKFMADGSFPLMSSMVSFPGYLEGGNGLVSDIPWDKYTETMLPYWEAGIHIHAHSNGDLATDQTLVTLAELQEKKPRFDHRFTIEHYSMTNTMHARKLKALGGVASVNIYFVNFRSKLHSDHGFGPDRSEAVARLGSLEREGVPFALHADYPQVIVPLNPLLAAWAAVNRIAEDGKTVMAPGERIGVYRAMRAITIDAAYILGMEDKIGSLEPGKFADFAVLEGDPFEVDISKIKDVPVWGTVLGGKVFKSKR